MIGNTESSWGWLAKLFHWVMFLVIVGAYVAVDLQESFEKGSVEGDWWMALHTPCQQKFLNASGRKDLIRGFPGQKFSSVAHT